MTHPTSTTRSGTAQISKAWIPFVVIDAVVTFFGFSYLFFPGQDVVRAGGVTEGVLAVPREVWGTFVVLSALAMLAVAVLGLPHRRRWARLALLYQFVFLAAVVLIEPDPVFPTIFALILALTLWFSRPSRGVPSAGRSVAEERPGAPDDFGTQT